MTKITGADTSDRPRGGGVTTPAHPNPKRADEIADRLAVLLAGVEERIAREDAEKARRSA